MSWVCILKTELTEFAGELLWTEKRKSRSVLNVRVISKGQELVANIIVRIGEP